MLPLSVTIIARDEADRIAEAIRSVSFADEVLVLDSGSTDDTVAIAQAQGARVLRTDWPGHVAQKNRALDQARHDWVLAIDADERVSPELAQAIARVREHPISEGAAVAYRVRRLSHWQGRAVRHGNWYPDWRVRLFDRRRARFGGRDPHDVVIADGPVVDLPVDLLHFPYRDLSEHVSTQDRYARIWADRALQDGVVARWWDLALRPPLHLVKALLLKRGFLDGLAGWVIAWLGATHVLLKWSRLWLARRGSGVS